MESLITLLIWGFIMWRLVKKFRKQKDSSRARRTQWQQEQPRQTARRTDQRTNSVGDAVGRDRAAQRTNSAGDAVRRDRAAQRTNSVGDDARLDRAAERANSVGETRPRNRHQRMVEEQRAKAEAYRRQKGAATVMSGLSMDEEEAVSAPAAPAAANKGRSRRSLCPQCGSQVKPGRKFCTSCGASLTGEAGIDRDGLEQQVAFSYSDGDRPELPTQPPIKGVALRQPSLTLPGWNAPELTRALVMAEILGPCKAGRVGHARR